MNQIIRTSNPSTGNAPKPCLCILALDVSGSMAGNPIAELNRALQEFYQAVFQDDEAAEKFEICIVTFGSEVRCIQEPAKIDDFIMPILEANGTTKLVDGIRLAIRQIEKRKEYYKKNSPLYDRPLIIVMTDGEPDNDQDIRGLYDEITRDSISKKYTMHIIGTGDCNFSKVAEFCGDTKLVYKLNGLNYSRFFRWLSNSIPLLPNAENLKQLPGSENIFEQIIIT